MKCENRRYRSIAGGVPCLNKMKLIVVVFMAILISTATSCKKETPAPKFTLGQKYGGGIIFYIDASGEHGLISAVEDQGMAAWNDGEFRATGATGTAIGTGRTNTTALIEELAEDGKAVQLCDVYEVEEFNDWFLPSKDELDMLYKNRDYVGGFTAVHYWTSSDSGNGAPWNVSFLNGYSNHGGNIGNVYRVRAIRTF